MTNRERIVGASDLRDIFGRGLRVTLLGRVGPWNFRRKQNILFNCILCSLRGYGCNKLLGARSVGGIGWGGRNNATRIRVDSTGTVG